MSFFRKACTNRLLVVDDEEDVLEFLSLFLGSLGWKVLTAPTCAEGLLKLQDQTCFLVLTDIAIPDMDGYEFVQLLRDRKAACEIALMSGFGYNPHHTLVRIRRVANVQFFFKPFDRLKVSQGVERAWINYHRDLYRAAVTIL